MLKYTLILLFSIFQIAQSNAQSVIVWSAESPLKVSDFMAKSPSNSGNLYGCQASCSIDFGFRMSAASFMLTKNFNNKVKAVFTRITSYLVANTEEQKQPLVAYSQCIFDVTELYARKFRKRLFEEKKAFSNSEFYANVQEELQKELQARENYIQTATKLGQNTEELTKIRTQVLVEIAELSDYCYDCKPKK